MSDDTVKVKRGRGRPRKDEFADLDEGFKSEAEGATEEQLKAIISKNKLGEITAAAAMKSDEDVQRLSGELKEARRPYKETATACDTRAKYCAKVASDRGRPLPGAE
jgi:hypothetical protein